VRRDAVCSATRAGAPRNERHKLSEFVEEFIGAVDKKTKQFVYRCHKLYIEHSSKSSGRQSRTYAAKRRRMVISQGRPTKCPELRSVPFPTRDRRFWM
jgi:hypothetical protein